MSHNQNPGKNKGQQHQEMKTGQQQAAEGKIHAQQHDQQQREQAQRQQGQIPGSEKPKKK